MPAVINIATNLAFGALIAIIAGRSLDLRRDYVNWPLLLMLAFEALIFTPIATFLFRFYPHWSLLYWFDPQVHPQLDDWIGWLSLLAVFLNFASALLGYTIARLGLIREVPMLRILPLACGILFIAYVSYAYGERIVLIGEGDAFWQGNASKLFSAGAGWLGLTLYTGMLGFLGWLHVRFGQQDAGLV